MSKRVQRGDIAQTRSKVIAALGATGAGRSGDGTETAPPGLSADERFVLDHFAADHDYKRTWKTRLRDEWAEAMAGYFGLYPAAASVLQRLRTASYFGTRGLDKYRPDPVPTTFDGRLGAYLDAPSIVRWERVYSLVIPGTMRTLWQAWSAVDGAAPMSRPVGAGFSSFPDAFTVRRAIAAAQRGQVPVGLQALDAANARAPKLPGEMTLDRIEALAREAGFVAFPMHGHVVVSRLGETEPLAVVSRIADSATGIRVRVSARLDPDVRDAVVQPFSRKPGEPWREVSIAVVADVDSPGEVAR